MPTCSSCRIPCDDLGDFGFAELTNLSLEQRLRLFNTRPFLGNTMTVLMREAGIPGYGDKKESKEARVKAVLEL